MTIWDYTRYRRLHPGLKLRKLLEEDDRKAVFGKTEPTVWWGGAGDRALSHYASSLLYCTPQNPAEVANFPFVGDFFRDCRKSQNVAILENSRIVKSITYVSGKTLFKVFRHSLLYSLEIYPAQMLQISIRYLDFWKVCISAKHLRFIFKIFHCHIIYFSSYILER